MIGRREDIQGLRALSALLIMIYHIWIGRVSGGVDVFFVVSGYFIGGGVLRVVESGTPFRPVVWWSRIMTRVLPSAAVVIFATALMSLYLAPPVTWSSSAAQVVASALQVENLYLMRAGAEYLGRDAPPSAFQQFWALSIQFQLYVGLCLLVVGVSLVGARRTLVFKSCVLAAVAVSFAVSLYASYRAPAPAYFNPVARTWEFLAGILVAWFLSQRTLRAGASKVVAVVGLALILLTGVVIPPQWPFPGFVALLPVIGAACLIVAGARHQTPVSRLLSWPWLTRLGDLSFSIYLIHWPLLVFTLHHTETASPSLAAGLGIIVASVALAVLLKRFVEQPLMKLSQDNYKGALAVCGVFVFFVAGVGAVGQSVLNPARHMGVRPTQAIADDASVSVASRPLDVPLTALTPGFLDFTTALRSDCVAAEDAREITHCIRGNAGAKRSIALVGGSHSFQWEPAFDALGKEHGFKIYVVGKISCAVGGVDYYAGLIGERGYRSCLEWNRELPQYLKTLNPDVIVTTATLSNRHGKLNETETTPDSYVNGIRNLARLGLPVIGLRDNPWFKSDPNRCLWRHRTDISRCHRPQDEVLASVNPAEAAFAGVGNVHLVDLNGLLCRSGVCLAKRPDLFVWADSHHITRSFALAMAPLVYAILMETPPFKSMTSARSGDRVKG